jgi:acetyltransferase-like isoleucine patch superfamily enzyme
MILKKIAKKLIIKLGVEIQKVQNSVAQASLPEFGNNPNNLRIELPRRIINPEKIFLGNNIWLGPSSLLIAITRYPTSPMQHAEKKQINQRFDPRITIGNRVTSTGDLQISALSQITIEDDVMFASNIHINDASHGFEHANEPYKFQNMYRIAPILIKCGCWIGQNVVILSGVTIGELAIIGSNSVVTKSIPDRCIAVGSPAKVMRKWNDNTQRWVSVANTDVHDTT